MAGDAERGRRIDAAGFDALACVLAGAATEAALAVERDEQRLADSDDDRPSFADGYFAAVCMALGALTGEAEERLAERIRDQLPFGPPEASGIL